VNTVFTLNNGNSPLLISMPHCGTRVPGDIKQRFSEAAKALPDTDWHIPLLYDFAKDLGATTLCANYSRYVVDLNRPPDNRPLYPGQVSTGLCPETLFDGTPLYQTGYILDESEIEHRRQDYWRPYHGALAAQIHRLQARFGYVLLYDAHSIASRVPRLFEGRLRDLNYGTACGQSCGQDIEAALLNDLDRCDYTAAMNQRFIGGYITRHYGQPELDVHAVQMELAQRNYMNETADFSYHEDLARTLKVTLRKFLEVFLSAGASHSK